jgi:3',5'-cyclic AMP phosphodiesterase CpdA
MGWICARDVRLTTLRWAGSIRAIVRLAHISDLHLSDRSRYPRHGIEAQRCGRHSTKPLEKLLHGLAEGAVDHLVVTGDVSMSGETSELQAAAKLLAPWAKAGKLTVLPGNHDVWSRPSAENHRFLRAVGPDGRGMKEAYRSYPHRVDLSPEVVLVALDSARWGAQPEDTPGELGVEQLQACREILREAQQQGRAAVVALHHHLVLPPERVPSDVHVTRMRLADADRLVRLAAELPIAAILHGHRHVPFRLEIPGAGGRPTPVLCAGSATRVTTEPARRPRAFVCAIDTRGLRDVETLVAA